MDIIMFREGRLTRVMVWSERVFSIVDYFVVVALLLCITGLQSADITRNTGPD